MQTPRVVKVLCRGCPCVHVHVTDLSNFSSARTPRRQSFGPALGGDGLNPLDVCVCVGVCVGPQQKKRDPGKIERRHWSVVLVLIYLFMFIAPKSGSLGGNRALREVREGMGWLRPLTIRCLKLLDWFGLFDNAVPVTDRKQHRSETVESWHSGRVALAFGDVCMPVPPCKP